MSESKVAAYIADLENNARAASIEEEDFRRNIAAKVREHEQARAFAYRRLNLMKTVAGAVAAAKDEEEAKTMGSAAFLREIGWTGATEFQRQTAEHFAPVAIVLWQANAEEAPEDSGKTIEKELAAFESWYAEQRETPFLQVMEQEAPVLPLVEVA